MIYEFIATLSAGFAMAGIALILRHLVKLLLKKQLPKWIIPLFTAVGIFAFQIHQEYNWFAQMQSKLPAGVKVVKTIEQTSWYRPWTYIKPQTVRFMAVDIDNMQSNQEQPHLKRTNLYLFERRMSSKIIAQAFDCQEKKQATLLAQNLSKNNQAPTNSNHSLDSNIQWISMNSDDKLYQLVCK